MPRYSGNGPATRMVVAIVAAALCAVANAAAADEWTLSGLELVRKPTPIIDIPRIRAQQAVGCSATNVRFGDTAFMRGFALSDTWPEPVRRQLGAAEMTDNAGAAQQRYRAAAAVPGLTDAQRAAVESQSLLATLQFGDEAGAKRMGDASLPKELPPEMKADRLFWGVIVRAKGATADDWNGPLDADLTEAQSLDRAHFGIRAWRVFAWLKGAATKTTAQICAPALERLQRRVLDVSEASPCPLMLGHFDHALSRFLGSAPETGPDRPERVWHVFAAAVMAEVARNTARTDALTTTLAQQKNPGPCRELLLDSLRRARQERQR